LGVVEAELELELEVFPGVVEPRGGLRGLLRVAVLKAARLASSAGRGWAIWTAWSVEHLFETRLAAWLASGVAAVATLDLDAAVGAFEAFIVEKFVTDRDRGAVVTTHQDLEATCSAMTLESAVIFKALAAVEDAGNSTRIIQVGIANSVCSKGSVAARA
jgi:hypothetical protein